jgi:hypothetical protein
VHVPNRLCFVMNSGMAQDGKVHARERIRR